MSSPARRASASVQFAEPGAAFSSAGNQRGPGILNRTHSGSDASLDGSGRGTPPPIAEEEPEPEPSMSSFSSSRLSAGRWDTGAGLGRHVSHDAGLQLEPLPDAVEEDDLTPDSDYSDDEHEKDLDRAEEEVDKILRDDLRREYGLAMPAAEGNADSADAEGSEKDEGEGFPLGWHEFSSRVMRYAENNIVVTFMMVITVIALFGEDFRLLALSAAVDDFWNWLTFVIFLCFSVEWVIYCIFKKDYFGSLFFWLDLLATLSLITDVRWMSESIFGANDSIDTATRVCVESKRGGETAMAGEDDIGDAAQVARSARAARIGTRAVRLIRIVRVLRILRVFKIFRFFGGFGGGTHQDEEMEMRANPTKIGARLAEKMSQRVILVVLVLFVGILLVMQLNELVDLGPEAGLDWMDALRVNTTVHPSSIPTTVWDTPKSNRLLVPHVAANTYVLGIEQPVLCLKDLGARGELFRHNPQALSDRRDIEVDVFWAESGMVFAVHDKRDDIVTAAWINVVMIMIILLVMVLSSYIFAHDTEEIVVRRISQMVESVNKMSTTLVFLQNPEAQTDHSTMETAMIEEAMDKMSTLLKIGFGEAGNAVIAKNLMGTGELNAMLPGQHVTAVFGFCDIRQFGELTDVLRGQVMPFVNLIAQIVHERVHQHQGAPNKNIGEAFLSVWKTEDFQQTPRGGKEMSRDNWRKMRRLSLAPSAFRDKMQQAGELAADEEDEQGSRARRAPPQPTALRRIDSQDDGVDPDEDEYTSKADQALLAFTETIREINSQRTELLLRRKHPRLYMKFPNFKINMGFGLHHGWAIEGAIGSMHKVDISYLSPHVNMSARLEAASKQFGVPLLLSGTFASLLSHSVRRKCRKIDRVKVVGSDKVMELWTCDEPRLSALTRQHKKFRDSFRSAMQLYIDGNWPHAASRLQVCHEILPEDGPTNALLCTIENLGNAGRAPSEWPGWHRLTSK